MNFSAHPVPKRPAIELRSVRRSLNTPVLSIAELPVGPGSAAIAAHADAHDGRLRYTLAVRCERSREVVFFCPSDEELGLSDVSLVAEAALSLAEGMGFLFEEDPPPISGEAAAAIWAEFVDAVGWRVAAVDPHAALRLTKFRRVPSRVVPESPAVEAGAPRTALGVVPGLDAPVDPIAHRGDF